MDIQPKMAELEAWVSGFTPAEADNTVVHGAVAVDDREGRLAMRERIDAFQNALQQIAGSDTGDRDQINDNGLQEYLVGGAYVRELFIPKGMFITSKIWMKTRMWIIASGEVTFTTEMGTQRVKGPFRMVVPHGSKVAFFTHEDTLWFAITGVDAEKLEDIEDEVTTMDYSKCVYPWDGIEGGGV